MCPKPRRKLTVSNTSWKAHGSEFNFKLSIILKKFSCFSYLLRCINREKLIQYVKIMDLFWDFTLCSVLGLFQHFKGTYRIWFRRMQKWLGEKMGQTNIRRLSEFRSVSQGSRRRDDCTKRVGVQTMTVMLNIYLLIIILQSLFCGLFNDIISISDYMVSIAESVNDEMNKNGPCLMRYFLDICLEGFKEC